MIVTKHHYHQQAHQQRQPMRCSRLVMVVLMLWAGGLWAQQTGFSRYNEQNGLPAGFVTRLFKDSRGILWLGTTNGLCRFDGRHFTTYGLKAGIPDLHVKYVDEHTDGRLIVGFHHGVYFFDGSRFSPAAISPATDHGLYYYKKQPLYDSTTKLIINGVHYAWQNNRFVALDHQAYPEFTTWIRYKQDTVISHPEGALLRAHNRKRETLLPATGMQTVFQFLNADTLLLARKNGLYSFNGKQLTLLQPLSIQTPRDVLDMTISHGHLVWISIEGFGTLCYDLHQKKLTHYHNGNSTLSHFDIPYYFGDDLVWFASSLGLVKYHTNTYTLLSREDHPAFQNIIGFFPAGHNRYWLSTSTALYQTTLQQGQVTGVQPIAYPGGYQPFTYISTQVGSGAAWLLNDAGKLAVYKPAAQTVHTPAWLMTLQKGNDPFFKPCYLPGPAATLVATPGKVCWFNQEGLVKNLPIANCEPWILRGFAEDSQRTIWGFHLDGFCRLSADTFRPVPMHPSLPATAEIICLQMLHDTLWAGTIADGLYGLVATPNGLKRVVHIQEENGLYGNCVYQLATDQQGDLWLLTNRGLQCLIPKNGQRKAITYFNKNIDFSELFFAGLQADDQGIIWYHNNRSVAGINPYLFKQAVDPLRVFITAVSVRDSLLPGAFSAQSFSYAGPADLHLSHRQNNLRIDFAAMCYTEEGLLYRYKLEGAEDGWNTDQSTEQITYAGLAPGHYTFRVSASTPAGQYGPETVFRFSIKPPFYKSTAFVMAIIGAAIVALLLGYRFKMARLARDTARQMQQDRRLAQMHMQALQAQMNPHFIFNALNSIQDYILSHETAEASRYLAKFAKLVRLILDNSSRNQMPIEEVADMLNRYLELEALRLDEDFEYTITLDEGIDTAKTAIPFMMVQPFVENAIWHGLMPKKGKKTLQISVSSDRAGGVIIIIDDNGVGRSQHTTPTATHKSVGSKIAHESFEALSTLLNRKSKLDIKDKQDCDGAPAGTTVIIHLPDSET